MNSHEGLENVTVRSMMPFFSSLWSLTPMVRSNSARKCDARHFQECIGCYQGLVREIAAFTTSPHESILNCKAALHWWQRIEAVEDDLMRELEAFDTFSHDTSFYMMCLLSCANAIGAQMQVLRQRLLKHLFSNREVNEVEMGTKLDALFAEEVSSAFRMDQTDIFCKKLQNREKQFVDNTMAIQRVILFISRHENDVMLEGKKREQEKSGNWKDLLYVSMHSFEYDVDGGSDRSSDALRISRTADGTWTDLQLINTLLNCAFTASACQQTFIAANYFAMVVQLLTTKCYIVEELLGTLYLLQVGKNETSPDDQDIKGETLAASITEFLTPSLLLKVCPKILLPYIMIPHGIASPRYSLYVSFVSLQCNTAYSLWQSGCIEEAHKWLCSVDVGCIRNIGNESKEGDKGKKEDASGLPYLLTWQYVLQHCVQDRHPSLNLFSNSNKPQTDVCNKGKERCSNGGGDEDQELSRLRQLLHCVACLRDLSAIILSCVSPCDVMYIFVKFQAALQCQHHRMMEAGLLVPQRGEGGTTVKENEVNVIAKVVVVLSLIVECYIARRAAHVFLVSKASSSAPPFSTAASAVRHICDELICILTSGKLSGLDKVEEQGLSSLWPMNCCENDVATLNGNDSEVQLTNHLIVQILGVILSVASSFEKSVFFQNVFSAAEKNMALQNTQANTHVLNNHWKGWPMSFASSMYGAACSFMKDVVFSQNETEGMEEKDFMEKREQATSCGWHHMSLLLPQSGKVRGDKVDPVSGGNTLWFPSSGTDGGLSLLAEEKEEVAFGGNNGDTSYSDTEQLALRLLVIACRYSDAQTLLELHQCPVKKVHLGDIHDMCLQFVVPDLDIAIENLKGELDRQMGSAWLALWRQQRQLSPGCACIARLLKGLVMQLPHVHQTAFPPAAVRFLDATGAAVLEEETEVNKKAGVRENPCTTVIACTEGLCNTGRKKQKLESDENEGECGENGTADILDSSLPTYTPSLRFDPPDFAFSSPEALQATRQLLDDGLEEQGELEGKMDMIAAKREEVTEEESVLNKVTFLSPAARRLVHMELPVTWQFMPWRLIYSTRFHGFSYSTMLACSQRAADTAETCGWKSPMLLVLDLIRPEGAVATGNTGHPRLVVGAYLSDPLRPGTRRFYGNNETFVFQILFPSALESPKLCAYHTTGRNTQFISCTPHTLAIGGGGGCSLFLDGTTTQGSTAACATFDSPPLTHWRVSSSSSTSLYTHFLSLSSSAEGKSLAMPLRAHSGPIYDFEVRNMELLVIEE